MELAQYQALNYTKNDWEILIDQLEDECVKAIDSGDDMKAHKLNELIRTIYAVIFNKKIDFCFG